MNVSYDLTNFRRGSTPLLYTMAFYLNNVTNPIMGGVGCGRASPQLVIAFNQIVGFSPDILPPELYQSLDNGRYYSQGVFSFLLVIWGIKLLNTVKDSYKKKCVAI